MAALIRPIPNAHRTLITLSPTEPFLTTMKVCFWAAVLAALPVWLYPNSTMASLTALLFAVGASLIGEGLRRGEWLRRGQGTLKDAESAPRDVEDVQRAVRPTSPRLSRIAWRDAGRRRQECAKS